MKNNRIASILALVSVAIFAYSIYWYAKADSMVTDSIKKMADAGFAMKDLVIEKARVAALHREVEGLHHKLEHASDTGAPLDGFFDTSTFTNSAGIPKDVVFISKRSYLQFPGILLIRLSDSEWSWATNKFQDRLITGTNSESENFVLTQ